MRLLKLIGYIASSDNEHRMQANKFDGLIFDLDGTLWDAAGACAEAWNEALKQFGNDSYRFHEDTIRSFSGLRIETIFKEHFHFIAESKHGELLEVYKGLEKRFMKRLGGPLYPHVKETLEALHNDYNLFIVSNCLSGYIENFIEFHTLEGLFTDFESSGNTGHAKSENIRRIVETNGLRRPVYIGDTVWDQDATGKATVPFIHAAYGFGRIDNAAWAINEFAELKTVLPQMADSIFAS